MNSTITYHQNIPEKWLNVETLHAAQLLPELQKPTIIKHPSKNQTENPRWLVTLQHANESSGLHAFVDIWKNLTISHTNLNYDVYFLIVNGYGATAREEYPLFGRRLAPNQIDYNRCWNKPGEPARTDLPSIQKEQIQELTDFILQTSPEYLLDIHNTTGKNKPLAFVQEQYAHNTLTHHLVDHIIYSDLLSGSLLDRFSDECETILVECGKTGTLDAFLAGRDMIKRFIQYTKEDQKNQTKTPLFYQELGRIVIKDQIDFSFYDKHRTKPSEKNKLLIRHDIENLNQTLVHDFGSLGIYEGNDLPIQFLEHGIDKTAEYIQMNGKEIEITKSTYGLLFTTNVHNIRITELGYLMERVG